MKRMSEGKESKRKKGSKRKEKHHRCKEPLDRNSCD